MGHHFDISGVVSSDRDHFYCKCADIDAYAGHRSFLAAEGTEECYRASSALAPAWTAEVER